MCKGSRSSGEAPSKNAKAGVNGPSVGKLFSLGLCLSSLFLLVSQRRSIMEYGLRWFLAPILGLILIVAIALLTLVLTTILLTRPKKPWIAAGDFTSKFSWDGKCPLKITFMTWGSHGDVQPNVALGLELARRGHKVTVMGMECFRPVIECHPELKYTPFEDDYMFKMASEFNDPDNRDKLPIVCAKFVAWAFRPYVRQYVQAAKDADVVVGQCLPICSLAQFTVAQVMKKPLFFVAHDAVGSMPQTTYSYDPLTNRIRDHGWLMNIINTRALPLIVGAINTISPWSEVRTCRREYGLSTPWPFMEFLGPRNASSIPAFCTWDPTLWPAPREFSQHWISTGFFVTKYNRVQDSEGVLEWLEKRAKDEPARKPIYAAFGSFEHHDKKVFTELLLSTAEKLQLDVVTLGTSVDDRIMPPNVFVARNVPHAEVFQKCVLILHHGGAGTASQVIRSGRPGVCVPAMHFQETWGARIEEYGAGVMITQEELVEAYQTNGENKLSEAFQAAMQPEVELKAKSLAEAARRAGGVELAADKIVEYLNDIPACEGNYECRRSYDC